MSDVVTFYYHPMSRARIAHWMLEESGAKYEIKILDLAKGEHKSPEFLKINPMGKIPAIVHKNTVVTETSAICLYLADAFPKAGLAPALDDPKRGTYYRWMLFTINCLEQAIADKHLPRTKQMPPSQLGYGTLDETVMALEDAVARGYLCGEKFSAADLYLCSVLGWYFMQKMMEPTPSLAKYVERCGNRPGFKRFNEQVQKLMAK
jgi:glutathione S-transferase